MGTEAVEHLCECGCGQQTKVIMANCASRGYVKGEHYSFVDGHQNRGRRHGPAYREAVSRRLMGHSVSRETRLKISEHHKLAGVRPSPEATAKSNQCRPRREKAGQWKGGVTEMPNGYIGAYAPDHPRAHPNGYVYQHILVAEEGLGRPLEPGEVVHHLDGDKHNNVFENLMVLPSQSEHARLHALEQANANL